MTIHSPRLPLRRRVYPIAICLTVFFLIHKALLSSSLSTSTTTSSLSLWEVNKSWKPSRHLAKLTLWHVNEQEEDDIEIPGVNIGGSYGNGTNAGLGSHPDDHDAFPLHGGVNSESPVLEVSIEEELERLFDSQPEWPATLNGPPTPRFKDNLREGLKYVTGFAPGGWTNDVISLMNLVYLGMIMERIPILPPFAPDHMPNEAGFINVGDIFDVPALSEAIGIPVLEWSQVKDLSAAQFGDHDRNRERKEQEGKDQAKAEKVEVEQVGCWSTWMTFYPDSGPRANKHEGFLGLDVSYTSSPDYIKLFPHMQELHSSFWGLAAVGFEEGDGAWKRQRKLQPKHHHGYTPPNTQLTCFDYLYFVAGTKQIEINHRVSPAWRFVGKHLKWSQRMLEITQQHLRASLDVPAGEPLPPHITVHVRRTDFANMCNGVTKLECLAPLSAYARRVEEVKKEVKAKGLLRRRRRDLGSQVKLGLGLDVEDKERELHHEHDNEMDKEGKEDEVEVVVTSDESDPEWWAEVYALGWKRVDFKKLDTEREFGKWYPSLIDAVVQSTGVGLVGTDGSTMSTVAGLRLENWFGGVWKLVRWGRVGADDH